MTIKTLTVSLTPRQEQFIQSQLESGRYPSADEMIAIALELLEESIYLEDSTNASDYERWVEETRNKVTVGIEQAEKGQLTDGKVVIARLHEKLFSKAPKSQA